MKIAGPPGRGLLYLLVRLWNHLNRRRQRQFLLLLGLMLVSAVMEVISLGAILPFLGVLTAPDRVFANPVVAHIARVFGVLSASQLLLPLTVVFVVVALIAGAIRMLLLWASTHLTAASGSELSVEVYRRTLYQPYHVHVARNSSELINSITNKVIGVVFGVMLPFITLISSIMLLIAIVLTLIAINPVVALVATVVFGSSYGLISWRYRLRLNRNSQRIVSEQTQVIKALQEGLGGIRDVLLDGVQPIYCNIYREADIPLRRAQADNAFIGQSPRYITEAVGMMLIAALAYGISSQSGGLTAALPVLGAFVIGAQRLLPAFHQIYNAWVSISGNYVQLADTIEIFDQTLSIEAQQPDLMPLSFRNTIRFHSVRFRYTSDGPWVLNRLSFTIAKGSLVGFVGSTGGGKSTALDLLMGLLAPTEGDILVDEQSISGSLRSWQKIIAHVPQSIYLADTTFAENIAFGVSREAINLDRVREAAHQAQIADFIEVQPEDYNACVGERGIRLSGGQRQRIGIARALYKKANVLIFDEATSALDNKTEQEVMEAIEGLDREITVLLIAHRLTTVRRCDIIFELERGQIVAQGSYEELLKFSPSFQRMAREPQNRAQGDIGSLG